MWQIYIYYFKVNNFFFFFLQNWYPIIVKCLNIGKNISKPIYRWISSYQSVSSALKYIWLWSEWQQNRRLLWTGIQTGLGHRVVVVVVVVVVIVRPALAYITHVYISTVLDPQAANIHISISPSFPFAMLNFSLHLFNFISTDVSAFCCLMNICIALLRLWCFCFVLQRSRLHLVI